jgi:ankyrin repeat protein
MEEENSLDTYAGLFQKDGDTIPRLIRQHIKGNPSSNLSGLQKVIDGGHDPNHCDVYGNNALHWACNDLKKKPATDFPELTESIPSTSEAGLIKFLLLNRTNPRKKNNRGFLPLHFAVRSWDNPTVASMLLLGSREIELASQRALAPLFIGIVGAIRKALNCDRATLFLADRGTKKLWSLVADSEEPIIIPWDKGLVGACFTANEIVNVADAWVDLRFENKFDKMTRYRTRSVLVCPVSKAGAAGTVGCLQAINKLSHKEPVADGSDDEDDYQMFSEDDEATLKRISTALSRSFSILTSAESSGHDRNVAEEGFIEEVQSIVRKSATADDQKEFVFKDETKDFVSPATRTNEQGYVIDGQYDWRRKHRHGVTIVNPDTKINWTIALLQRAKGGMIDHATLDGKTPLMLATIHGNCNTVRRLLQLGADPDLVDRKGNSALHYAAMQRNYAAAKRLMGAGCDPFQLNNAGLDPYDISVGACVKKETIRDGDKFSGLMKAVMALWLRVLHRGHQNTWNCSHVSCPLAIQTQSSPVSICGERGDHGMNITVLDATCFACGKPYVAHEFDCKELVAQWPYVEDGLSPAERFARARTWEKEIRQDIHNIMFWEGREYSPMSALEMERHNRARRKTLRAYGMDPEHPGVAASAHRGHTFEGSRICLFTCPLEELPEEATESTSDGVSTAAAPEPAICRWSAVPFKMSTARPIPRGWCHATFRFTAASDTLRLRKNAQVQGRKLTLYHGKLSAARDKTLTMLAEEKQAQIVFAIPVHSQHCIVTKADGGYGNDTVTVNFPSNTLRLSSSNYFWVIDEGSFCLGKRRVCEPLMSVNPRVEFHFVTDAGQMAWNRSLPCDLKSKHLIFREISLSHLIKTTEPVYDDVDSGPKSPHPKSQKEDGKEKSTLPVVELEAWKPFFLPKWPPRMIWRSSNLIKVNLANQSMSDRIGGASARFPSGEESAKRWGKAKTLLSMQKRVIDTRKSLVSDYHVLSLAGYNISVRFKIDVRVLQKIMRFRFCFNHVESATVHFQYDWELSQFLQEGKISEIASGDASETSATTVRGGGGGGCLVKLDDDGMIYYVEPFDEYSTTRKISIINWTTGARQTIDYGDYVEPTLRTEWIEHLCDGNPLSRKKDFVRYNPRTNEFRFDFFASPKGQQINIGELYSLEFSILDDDVVATGSEVYKKNVQFSSCPVCAYSTDIIIFETNEFNDKVRVWPPPNFAKDERKGRHPLSTSSTRNALNGHVREPEDILIERRHLLKQMKDPTFRPSVSQKKLFSMFKLQQSLLQEPSSAALFMGDWFGSVEMRQMTFTDRRLLYMSKQFGTIWPEALLTMIVSVYLHKQETLVYHSISVEHVHGHQPYLHEYSENIEYNGTGGNNKEARGGHDGPNDTSDLMNDTNSLKQRSESNKTHPSLQGKNDGGVQPHDAEVGEKEGGCNVQ